MSVFKINLKVMCIYDKIKWAYVPTPRNPKYFDNGKSVIRRLMIKRW